METLLVILGVVAYLLVGCFVVAMATRIMKDHFEGETMMFVVTWPVITIFGIGLLFTKLTDFMSYKKPVKPQRPKRIHK